MPVWQIILIAVGLAMDAVAVCVVAATNGYVTDRRAVFRLAFHFGLFQFLMPMLGWAVGEMVAGQIGVWDHWIAFALLAFVGGRMIWAGLQSDTPAAGNDPTRGLTMVMLSTATSLDALAVGLSLALAGIGVFYPSLLIGLITGGLCVVAIALGNRLRRSFSRGAELVGGGVLILIGARILWEHLR